MRVARNNNVVFAALCDRLWSDLDALRDVVLDGDEHTVADVARTEVPGLAAGLQALLALHVPDANGHCTHCRAGRWWRREPVPCRALLEFQLARDNATGHHPRHRLSTARCRAAPPRLPRCRAARTDPPDDVVAC
ncbi:hypothetical protein ACFXGA_10130 [Actinosynnema sp. NPDC059335]|uniref:hypothetical protein n=1 Tax=Actinosynnema sp. NPDC059335 TaxID=3346804 RepID=UPI00366C7A4B